MKPIETRYSGYRFRSRLEARVAVWLDALGWRWEYEPEGYDLDGVYYLPDFLIRYDGERGGKIWLEVKALEPTAEEKLKASRLAAATDTAVLFQIGTPDPEKTVYGLDGFDEHGKYCASLASLSSYCKSKWNRPGWLIYDEQVSAEDRQACYAARSARFEHGESGAPGIWVPAHG